MSDYQEQEVQRLRSIERNVAVLRMLVAILPLWAVGEILIRFSPDNMRGYGLTVLGLTAALLVLGIIRLIMTTSFVEPEHRFFNDAKRVAAFIDRTRTRGYIPVYGPSELFKLKLLNLVFQPLGWGLLLAFMFGGYVYIMDNVSGGHPWPAYSGLFFKWGMPGLFLCFIYLAISSGISTINSKEVTDFPLTRALLSSKKPTE